MTEAEKATQENTIAIGKVIGMVEHLTKDVDKVVKHLDLVPAVRVQSLEKRMGKLENSCNKRAWTAFSLMVAVLGAVLWDKFFANPIVG